MRVETQSNQGICRTLNRCLEISQGSWIALLASDDRYRPNFVERMVAEARRNQFDEKVFHCDAVGIDEFGNEGVRLSRIRKIPPLNGESFSAIVYGHGFIVSSTMFLSRHLMEIAGPYDTNLRAEDFDIHLRLARVARFSYLNEPLFLARKVSGSLGSRRKVWSDDIFTALAKHEDFLGPEYAKVLLHRHKKLATDFYGDLDFQSAKHHFGKAMKLAGRKRVATLVEIVKECGRQSPRVLLLALLPKSGVRFVRTLKRRAISS